MQKEFLTELGIDEMNADKILAKTNEEISQIKIRHAVLDELSKNGAKNINAAIKLFDTEGLTVDNDEVTGLDEKMKSFIKENDFLFQKENTPIFSAPIGDNSNRNISHEEFLKMGYAKRLKLFNEDPQTYNELSKNK